LTHTQLKNDNKRQYPWIVDAKNHRPTVSTLT